jgi:hypothetical protein
MVDRFVVQVAAVALKLRDEARDNGTNEVFSFPAPARAASGQFMVDAEHSV